MAEVFKKPSKRLGVIDCGTNTFHLLVVDVDGGNQFIQIHRERRYVRIGQEGVDRIGDEPFRRGVDCLVDYKKLVGKFEVDKLKVFGTEALRRASNGQDFVLAVERETGIPVQLISGKEEARLIHLGVTQAIPPIQEKGLIMDIGGGSVEFIIASAEEVFWTQSFPIGVQVLFSNFHQQDPLPKNKIDDLWAFLENELQPLITSLKKHMTPVLIGASGSFEVVEEMHDKERLDPLYSRVPVTDYSGMYQKVISSSLAERYAMENLPSQRAELIVVAFILIDFVIKKAGIQEIVTSAYAMKEGILLEMMQEA